ncbi:hypothetical protein AWC25_24055 [Mycobacterium sherrisii]|uniref:Thiolase C-terminal domain-containing protein n=1 Tax=Mycobacterium sherrisii TaxID=243061 RepID=A0A1E3SIN2_9MYCO|nr:hypothetical protein BHQ21_23000 [Mycobacterium sherrisii]ORW84575.1 hypothetical protein AWC25_24055 [Mycobacterium sherrisii]
MSRRCSSPPPIPAWAHDTGADLAKTNVNGGAIAIGHPLGASGARIMTTMVNALEQRGGRYGLQTMCEGGGMANATIIERLGNGAANRCSTGHRLPWRRAISLQLRITTAGFAA